MAAFPAVKAVVFDAYGTLLDVHAPMTRLAAEIGPKASAVSELWRQKQLQYTWLRSLMGAHADFWQVTAEALDYALAAHAIDDAALRDRLMALYRTLDAYGDALPALQALKDRRTVTAVLSNGSPSMLDDAVHSAGLAPLLDHVLSVEAVGCYKPDPRVYRLAEERLGLRGTEIGFVSANGWDAAGAAHYGFATVHLNRFGQPAERLPARPGLTVASLAAFAAMVAAP